MPVKNIFPHAKRRHPLARRMRFAIIKVAPPLFHLCERGHEVKRIT